MERCEGPSSDAGCLSGPGLEEGGRAGDAIAAETCKIEKGGGRVSFSGSEAWMSGDIIQTLDAYSYPINAVIRTVGIIYFRRRHSTSTINCF